MPCKAPVCSQEIMQGNKLEGSLARELVCHPCTALSLGWTVWGVQADWERTFLGCSLVNLHLYKAAILLKFSVLLFSKTRCFFFSSPHAGVPPHSWQTCAWLLCRGGCMCVCVHMSPCSLSPEAGAILVSGEASWAETDPALLFRGPLAKKSRIKEVILGYKEANMVRRDNRSDVADNAVLLALRLCWCFIPWHKVKVCPAPDEEAPHGHAATVHARPALLSPSCLPELLVPLC